MVVTVHFVGFHPTMILDGFEKLRLSKPIERVYLLYDSKSDRYGAVSKYNAKRLAQVLAFFKPVLMGVNPQSYSSVFSRLFSILKLEVEENKREVYVDCTDMPQEAMSAVVTLALMFGSSPLSPTPIPSARVCVYAVSTERRGDFIPPPDSPRFYEWIEEKDNKRGTEIKELPLPSVRLQLHESEEEELKILTTLYAKGGRANSLKNLIEWCEGAERARDYRVKNAYSRAVSRLVLKGLLYKTYGGKVRRIGLTEFGRTYVEAVLKAKEFKERLSQIEKTVAFKPLAGAALEL